MFLHPVMLAGIGAAVVPLVLHFLSRSRFRTVNWGAMMFLSDPDQRRFSTAGLRQWTLLFLRSAILVLLAITLARPVIAGWWGNDAPHRLIVLVIDCSASMAAPESAGRSRMELAKTAARRLLSRTQPGDLAAVIPMGGDSDPHPITDIATAASRISELTPEGAAADIASSLLAARDLCDHADSPQHPLSKEIYVICDRQARSWDGVGDAFANNWQARSPRPSAHLYVLPVGGESAENLAIDSVRILDEPIVRGQPVGVEVRLHNYGSQPRLAVPLSVSLSSQTLFTASANLDPGAVESLRGTIKFPDAGPQILSASLTAPDLPADNQMQLAVDVLDPLKVLIISGDEHDASPAGLRNESAFLKMALAPFADAPKSSNLAAVTIASPEDPHLPLESANAIVLANVPHLTEPTVTRLEKFVYSGGGLMIAPGSLCQIDEYRRWLYRNGAGLMPADLHLPRAAGVSPTSLLGLTLDHPIFGFLRSAASPLPTVSIARYFPADLREGDSRVLASYATGDPFLIEGTFGAGRVLLVTTPLDADWSDLPLTNFYLPFIQSCVRYISKVQPISRNLRVGDPLVLHLDIAPAEKSIHLFRPDGRSDDASLDITHSSPAATEIRYTPTRLPGQYVLSYQTGPNKHQILFLVKPPASESDLTPLGEESWDRLQHALGFELLPPASDQPATNTAALIATLGRFRSDLWLSLLAAVIVLLLLETAIARLWSRGDA